MVKRFVPCVRLASLILATPVFASQSTPTESIKAFFDHVVRHEVQQAANSGVFSDEQAKAEFVREWSTKSRSLTGYRIEEWEIERAEGSTRVSFQFSGTGKALPLEASLVKLDGVWRVSPQKDLKLEKPILPPPLDLGNLEDLVTVTSKTKKRWIEISIENQAPFSVLLHFEMDLPSALRPDCALPIEGILAPTQDPIPLCNLQIVRGGWRYSWSYTVKRADDAGEMVPPGTLTFLPEVPEEEPAFFLGEEYAYGVPYPPGEACIIWQGPGGSFSHNEPGSLHAADFSLPMGAEVAAARGGLVVGVIQKNPNNPIGETADPLLANEVLILHADGTLGVYAHLTTDGAKVSFGDRVRRGQVIGHSGNSGYSRGPHLHFVILGYGGRRSVSLPFGFFSEDGQRIVPRKGLVLLSQKTGTAKAVPREIMPRKIARRFYEEFDSEVRYFSKDLEFLARNTTSDLIGVELLFTSLENLISTVSLPRRIGLPPDGEFHEVLNLEVADLERNPAFSFMFRRVEAPGKEHIPLRVETEEGDGYEIDIRYFSDRLEFVGRNKSSRVLVGSLDFPSLDNLALKEKSPVKIHLPADRSAKYLATLRIVNPIRGYSFTYRLGPEKEG